MQIYNLICKLPSDFAILLKEKRDLFIQMSSYARVEGVRVWNFLWTRWVMWVL